MFDRLLSRLSLRRSTAGIYYELRTIRQMLEMVAVDHGYELPHEHRLQRHQTTNDELSVDAPDEEQLAEARAMEIRRARLDGKDPGTGWEEDPNR